MLVFVAPRAQKFAVVGDSGIHQRCGDDPWNRVVQKMGEHFRQEHFTDALVDAIHDLGQVLAEQFPRVAGEKAVSTQRRASSIVGTSSAKMRRSDGAIDFVLSMREDP